MQSGTLITCPQCAQRFSAILEQVIDVDSNPQSKTRLLSGELNMLVCPHCGFQFTAHTPMVYHDGHKELLITFIPMELNLPQAEQERIIGALQQSLINSLPSEQRKGYLFTPKNAITMQSLIDQVLAADGITPEMQAAHKARIDLIEMLLGTSEEQLVTVIEAHDEDIDEELFHTLDSIAQVMAGRGEHPAYESMSTLYNALIAHSGAGHAVQERMRRQEDAVAWAKEKIHALGNDATQAQLLDLIIEAGTDDNRLQAVAGITWPALDYTLFQMLTERIEAGTDAERTKLEAVRDRLVDLTTHIEQQNRAAMEQATNTLRTILQAPDVETALHEHMGQIDDMFMSVLVANIQAAEQAGEIKTSAKLKQIYEQVIAIIQASAPPEVRFLNALLMTESDAEAEAIIDAQAGEFGPEVAELMKVLIADLREGGQTAAADRMSALQAKLEAAVGAA